MSEDSGVMKSCNKNRNQISWWGRQLAHYIEEHKCWKKGKKKQPKTNFKNEPENKGSEKNKEFMIVQEEFHHVKYQSASACHVGIQEKKMEIFVLDSSSEPQA